MRFLEFNIFRDRKNHENTSCFKKGCYMNEKGLAKLFSRKIFFYLNVNFFIEKFHFCYKEDTL